MAALLIAVPGAASADTAPPDSSLPLTVSADVLPTPQIDGVVWSQVVTGDRVYVGGDFRNARPFGAAVGVDEVPRANILAYDINSGELIDSFAPVLDGQVLSLAVSPDGSTVYAGGSFQKVDGQWRVRMAAFDAATGALDSDFRPVAGATVRAVTASDTTVYFGGDFAAAADRPGQPTVPRAYLAAAAAASGAITDWNPSPNNYIRSIALTDDQSKVVVGGHFTTLMDQDWYGMAALDPETAQPQAWAALETIRDAGPSAAINSLTADADGVLVTGYSYGGGGGNFEGVARLDGDTGAVEWISDCRGDHHSAYGQADVAYTVSHAHRCANVPGGFEERWPRVSPGGAAFTDFQVGELLPEVYGWVDRAGQPAPQQLHFWPDWYFGTYTASDQGAWHVTGNDKYVVFGGEFIGLNGRNQQGLTRMARPDAAPNDVRPFNTPELQPSAVSYRAGEAHVGWQETYDHDNERLTYEVYRNFVSLQQSQPVHTVTADSAWHERHSLSFIDRGLTPGQTYDYLVIATDPLGNRRTSERTPVTIASGASDQVYGNAVLQDLPDHYFRFSGDDATNVADLGGASDATSLSGVSLTGTSPVQDAGDKAGDFDGGTSAYAANRVQAKAPNQFTIEAWVNTTDGSGGRIVGFSTDYVTNSNWTDRHLYLDSTGRIRFGVDDLGSNKVTIASDSGYDDGQWHHVAGSLSAGGMKLYVDGELVAQNAGVTEGRRMTGTWRIGKDVFEPGWTSAPSDGQLDALIDEVAVYPRALAEEEIREHFEAASGSAANAAPVASFSSSVDGRSVSFDGSGSSDSDGSVVSYAWDFGDGASGSGAVVEHTYGGDGPFDVTLTVVDDDGEPGSATQTVSFAGDLETVAADAFGRSVASGWGTADLGGDWSSCSTCSVSGDAGLMSLAAGVSKGTSLSGLSLADADVTVKVSLDRMPTGSGTYLAVLPRSQGDSGYRARLQVLPDGSMAVRWQLLEGGSQSTLASGDVPGLTVAAGDELMLRAQALGSSPTQLGFKVWRAGDPEPAGWTLTATDSDPDWQRSGAPGLWAFVSAAATAATGLTWDDLVVTAEAGAEQPNAAPVASFSSSVDGRSVSFDGSGSSDSDGSVVSYAWDFGDGASGSGAVVEHTYGGDGPFDVTLTVVDDDGEPGSATQTVSFAGDLETVAADAFGRSVASGWGTADLGGDWSSCSTCSVSGDAGLMSLAAGVSKGTSLSGLSLADADVTVKVSLDRMPTGSGTYLAVLPRSQGDSGYRARLQVLPDGSMAVRWQLLEGGSQSTLASGDVPGLTVAAGDELMLRAQALGSSPTQLGFKVWRAGDPEPAGWTLTATDSDPDWQRSGAPGLWAFVSAAATAATGLTWDDLVVTAEAGAEQPNAAPVASFSSSVDGRSVSFDGSGSSDSDGSVVSYAWDFGDGASGSGAVVEHTYGGDGPFDVTLTVVDDDGEPGSATQTVSFAGDLETVAADAFGRSVASGWGTADLGGDWSSCSTCSVSGDAGLMSLAAGVSKGTSLSGLSLADADVTVKVSLDRMPTGSGTYLAVLPRSQGDSGYRARLQVLPDGSMAVRWQLLEGGSQSTLASGDVPGLTVAAGDELMLRAQALGSSPTQLGFKVWRAGDPEPAGWTLTATDSDPDWQRSGAPGLWAFVSAAATAATGLTWDDLDVRGG